MKIYNAFKHDTHILVKIHNFSHLEILYGELFSKKVTEKIYNSAFKLGLTIFSLKTYSFIASLPKNRHKTEEFFIEKLLLLFNSTPILIDKIEVLPIVSISKLDMNRSGLSASFLINCNESSPPPILIPPEYSNEWRAQYEKDMSIALYAVSDLKRKLFTLEYQEVFSSIYCHYALYEETILKPNPKNNYLPKDGHILYEHFNRIGLTRLIHRYTIESTIDKLSKEPYRIIACKISASSLLLDHWWLSPIKKLSQTPSIAKRLIIEVVEDYPLQYLHSAKKFMANTQKLGCRFTLTRFDQYAFRADKIATYNFDFMRVNLRSFELTHEKKTLIEYLIETCKKLEITTIIENSYDKHHNQSKS
jgi:EAL domain-containing protein (putative c-di-GMP-specific phosphodiesterase class I)